MTQSISGSYHKNLLEISKNVHNASDKFYKPSVHLWQHSLIFGNLLKSLGDFRKSLLTFENLWVIFKNLWKSSGDFGDL